MNGELGRSRTEKKKGKECRWEMRNPGVVGEMYEEYPSIVVHRSKDSICRSQLGIERYDDERYDGSEGVAGP